MTDDTIVSVSYHHFLWSCSLVGRLIWWIWGYYLSVLRSAYLAILGWVLSIVKWVWLQMVRRCMGHILYHSFLTVFVCHMSLVLFTCGLPDSVWSIVVYLYEEIIIRWATFTYLLLVASANTASVILYSCGFVMTSVVNSCMWAASSSSWSSVNIVSRNLGASAIDEFCLALLLSLVNRRLCCCLGYWVLYLLANITGLAHSNPFLSYSTLLLRPTCVILLLLQKHLPLSTWLAALIWIIGRCHVMLLLWIAYRLHLFLHLLVCGYLFLLFSFRCCHVSMIHFRVIGLLLMRQLGFNKIHLWSELSCLFELSSIHVLHLVLGMFISFVLYWAWVGYLVLRFAILDSLCGLGLS